MKWSASEKILKACCPGKKQNYVKHINLFRIVCTRKYSKRRVARKSDIHASEIHQSCLLFPSFRTYRIGRGNMKIQTASNFGFEFERKRERAESVLFLRSAKSALRTIPSRFCTRWRWKSGFPCSALTCSCRWRFGSWRGFRRANGTSRQCVKSALLRSSSVMNFMAPDTHATARSDIDGRNAMNLVVISIHRQVQFAAESPRQIGEAYLPVLYTGLLGDTSRLLVLMVLDKIY